VAKDKIIGRGKYDTLTKFLLFGQIAWAGPNPSSLEDTFGGIVTRNQHNNIHHMSHLHIYHLVVETYIYNTVSEGLTYILKWMRWMRNSRGANLRIHLCVTEGSMLCQRSCHRSRTDTRYNVWHVRGSREMSQPISVSHWPRFVSGTSAYHLVT
jgi:hypothetical protein